MNKESKEKIIEYGPSKNQQTFSWGLVIVAFIFTWFALLWVYFNIPTTTEKANIDIAELNDRISSPLMDRIDLIEEQLNQLTPAKIALKAVPSELPPQGPVARPEKSVEIIAVTQEDLNVVVTRIESLQKELDLLKYVEEELRATKQLAQQQYQGHFSGLVMSMLQLQQQMQKGNAFDTELKMARTQTKGDVVIDQYLSTLAAYSETGVLALEDLKTEFSLITKDIIAAVNTPQQHSNMWDKAVAKLSEVVSIRRIDVTEGNDVQAIVAKAEAAVAKWRIGDSIVVLNRLPEGPKLAATDWLSKASARVAVEHAIENIFARIAYTASNPVINTSNDTTSAKD